MKFGVPWNVKGVRPEARDSAREAARRSGLSVGEWLNNAILEQAGGDGSDSYRDGAHRPARDQDQIRDSIERLDRRLDQIMAQPQARNYQPSYAPPPPPSPDPWSTTIEQAIA
jgi:localization factor PodJL